MPYETPVNLGNFIAAYGRQTSWISNGVIAACYGQPASRESKG